MSNTSVEGETTRIFYKHVKKVRVFVDLLRGSRGPSTVTFMALQYVATCRGSVFTVIVNESVFPIKHR